MRRIFLLCASMVLAMLLVSEASLLRLEDVASAASAGESEKIVFASYRTGNSDIYIMNPDGSDKRRLTYTTEHEGQPTISPDGTRIAFERSVEATNAEIYVMNSNGSDQTRLTFSPRHDQSASFSPDGSKIAFYSDRNAVGGDIYVMNADGSNQTRLTSGWAGSSGPEFSPDGSKIVFNAQRFSPEDDGRPHIYIMNSDGSNQTKLTNGPGYAEGAPTFSPDGSKIAFVANLDEAGIGQHAQIYNMNVDGTQLTRLTSNLRNDVNPSYSPDGSKIAFESDRDGDNLEIYAMNSDGSQQSNLTNYPAVDHSPYWGQVIDKTTPTTTTTLSAQPNANGWHKQDVTITLSATDQAAGSGIKDITYSATGAQPVSETKVPGSSAQLTITKGGQTTITYFATDQAGNAEQPPKTLTIKLDKSAPKVISFTPPDGTNGVAGGVNVTATFSERMQAATVKSAFKLYKKGSTTPVAAVVSYDATSKKATLNPTNSLQRGSTYKAVVSTGAKDMVGNQLDQNSSAAGLQQKVWFFEIDD